MGNGFAILELAAGHEHAELLERFGPDLHVLADDESFDGEPRLQDERWLLHRNRRPVVAADHAAQGDASERVHACDRGVEDRAADVLETSVNAVGRRLLERLVEGLCVAMRLVVDAGVETELVDDVGALLDAAGDAYGTAAACPGELAHS